MKRLLRLAVLVAVFGLLAACGQKPLYYPLKENTAQRAGHIPEESRRAGLMAADLCVVSGTESPPDGSVVCAAAGVFSEADERVVVQKQVFQRMYPASITKVMTALVVLKDGNLDDKVTVGQEVVITEEGASLCKIAPGDTLTMRQLLYGLMLPSGNDAGAAIAVHMDGSIEAFADRMNEEARRLGATGTHFINPHGLHDENHYTTAYDLYLIMHEAMKQPVFREIIGTSSYMAEYTDRNGGQVFQVWENSNQFLNGRRAMPQGLAVIGGKTGTTKAAGYCLLMAIKDKEGREYISVVMKSDSRDHLYEGMANIIQNVGN